MRSVSGDARSRIDASGMAKGSSEATRMFNQCLRCKRKLIRTCSAARLQVIVFDEHYS